MAIEKVFSTCKDSVSDDPTSMHYTMRQLSRGGEAFGACEACHTRSSDVYYILTEYRRYTRQDGTQSSTRAGTIQLVGHMRCLSHVINTRVGLA